MKVFPLFAAISIYGAVITAFANPIQFGEKDDPQDHFFISASSGSLKFQSENSDTHLVFEPSEEPSKNGALVAAFAPKNAWHRSLAKELALEFRLPQKGSFGVQIRASDPKEKGYLILVNQDAGTRGTLKVFKTTLLPPSGNLANDVIATKAIGYFRGSQWHRLSLVTENVDSGHVKISARLTDITAKAEVELTANDTQDPLESDGLVAMRFYLQPASADEFEDGPRLIEVRHFSISPALE